jgi:hypothetical protein
MDKNNILPDNINYDDTSQQQGYDDTSQQQGYDNTSQQQGYLTTNNSTQQGYLTTNNNQPVYDITNNIVPVYDAQPVFDNQQYSDVPPVYSDAPPVYDDGYYNGNDNGNNGNDNNGNDNNGNDDGYYNGYYDNYGDGSEHYKRPMSHVNTVIKIAFTDPKQKKISIPVAIIIGLIIIIGIIILVVSIKNKIQYNRALMKYSNVDLALCHYGLNKEKTDCKKENCPDKKGSINTMYGDCTQLKEYCNKAPTVNGITSAHGSKCNFNCNNSLGNPQWHFKSSTAPVSAYKNVWMNTPTGKCTLQPKCYANGVAADGYNCKSACPNNSGNTTHGRCTYNGCPYGITTLKPIPTRCNLPCPSANAITTTLINSNATFKHTASGKCYTHCPNHNGVIYLPNYYAQGQGKYTCKPTCTPIVEQIIITDAGAKVTCTSACEWGPATNSGDPPVKCNDKCDYKKSQNKLGKCKPITVLCGVSKGKTLYLRKNIKAHGYSNGGDNKKIHNCNKTCPNIGNMLGKSTLVSGECEYISCPSGISAYYHTKCNEPCGLLSKNTGIYRHTTPENADDRPAATNKYFPASNTCKVACQKYNGNSVTGGQNHCIQNCDTVQIGNAAIGYYKGYNIATNNMFASPKMSALLQASVPPGGCMFKPSCVNNGIAKDGLNCKQTRPKNNTTRFGGKTYHYSYYAENGQLVACKSGANLNSTYCNKPCDLNATCINQKWDARGNATGIMTKNGMRWGYSPTCKLGTNHRNGMNAADFLAADWAYQGIAGGHAATCYSVGYGNDQGQWGCVSNGANGNSVYCVNCTYGPLTRMRQRYDGGFISNINKSKARAHQLCKKQNNIGYKGNTSPNPM